MVLSTVLGASVLLSACSTNKEAPEPTAGQNQPSPPNQSVKPAREKMSLNFFLGGDANAVLPAGDDDFIKKTIEQKFNVELKIDTMPFNEDRKNKLYARIAAGDIPDMFLSVGNESIDLAKQGVFADLSKYVTPQKMPNYFKWVTEDEVKRFQLKGSFVRAPRPVEKRGQWSYWIRKDWLDKLQLNMPTNYDELTNVMRAFAKKDPDGNGKDDTYGFTLAGDGKNIPYMFPQFKKHGLIGTGFVDANGEFHDSTSDPKAGAVIDDIRVWIKEGLLDPDWYLSSGAKVYEKFAQGKVGMVWGSGAKAIAFESEPSSYYNMLKKVVPTAEIVPFNPFPNDPVWVEDLMTLPFLINVKLEKEPAKMERIIEILDWLCSEEGFLLTSYGQEGKHFTRSGKEITLKPDAIKTDIIDKGNFLSIWGFMVPGPTTTSGEPLGIKVVDPRMTDRDRKILDTLKTYKFGQGFGTSVVPPEGVNTADVRKRLNELLSKMLFEDKDSSNWPKYREELMTTYKGKQLFDAYVQQMRAVGLKVNDFK